MYKKVIILIIAVTTVINFGFSQDIAHKDKVMKNDLVKHVTLEQTKGDFSVKALTLDAGTYQFEIVNNNAGVDVGFVVAPVATPNEHIKEAYVTEVVKNNTSEKTNLVSLTPGEYIYFCPLNKTPQYSLTVK